MNASKQEQTVFWTTLANGLAAGKTLMTCLKEARSALAGSSMEKVADSLIASVNAGKTLSESMKDHTDAFDQLIVEAVVSGEYGGVLDTAAAIIAEALEKGDLGILKDRGLPYVSGAIEYVSGLLERAFEARASDIHLDPIETDRGLVRMRIDGVLHEVPPPAEGLFPKVIDYIKVMAAMNVAEKALPQHGQCIMDRDRLNRRLHISTVPTIHGERVVVRILIYRKDEIPLGLDKLGLTADDLEKVRRISQLPSGMIVITGPTGNGITTLLYSMLVELNRQGKCIITIEDPVELSIGGFAQIQIRPKAGLTYAKVLRSVLYQDPDVIMVGELLDLETIQTAVLAVTTGHLLLTTMHANTAVGAIRRLLDMGLMPHEINSSMVGVVALRLIRLLCDKCKQPKPLAPLHSQPPAVAEFLANHRRAEFFGPVGCEECHGTGYRGKTGIFEILGLTDEVRQMLVNSAEMTAIHQKARQMGMKTLLESGMEKAAAGLTSVEEVLRVTHFAPNT